MNQFGAWLCFSAWKKSPDRFMAEAIPPFWLFHQNRESIRPTAPAHQQEVHDGFRHCCWYSRSWRLLGSRTTVLQHSEMRCRWFYLDNVPGSAGRDEACTVDLSVLDNLGIKHERNVGALEMLVPSSSTWKKKEDCCEMGWLRCRRQFRWMRGAWEASASSNHDK